MNMKKSQKRNDLIELLIVLAFIAMIFTIYVPVGIWEEEDNFRGKSRFRMKTIYGVESFFELLTDTYETDGLWAMNVVNAVRDSLTADSTYLGLQAMFLNNRDIHVDIPNGFETEYDTTFGFMKMRRDTITDTTVTIVVFSEELSRNDTVFIQGKTLNKIRMDPYFRKILSKEPVQRIEVVEYYDKYMPDSSMFFCPVTNDPYKITLEESSLKIASPITEIYKESRYIFFALS